jgi:AbrB family looped-hinge helix DNA binding protein
MKSHTDSIPFSFDDAFYGTSTMGERGQLVIPAEARADLDMSPGDKLLIMRHPIHKGLMLFKLAHVKQFLDDFSDNLNRIEIEESLEVPAE